jgi:hypothetical protein
MKSETTKDKRITCSSFIFFQIPGDVTAGLLPAELRANDFGAPHQPICPGLFIETYIANGFAFLGHPCRYIEMGDTMRNAIRQV